LIILLSLREKILLCVGGNHIFTLILPTQQVMVEKTVLYAVNQTTLHI
jgi:hypothetical protein